MDKAIGDDAKRRLARGDSKERPKEIVIRSRRPLSSTEKRKSRFTMTIDDGAATNRVPALPPDVDMPPLFPCPTDSLSAFQLSVFSFQLFFLNP